MIDELYEKDYNLWLEVTKQQLANREFEAMDLSNLIEEIDDMGKSQKRSLDSYTQKLIEHLLKLQWWRANLARSPRLKHAREDSERERCAYGWRREVNNFRIAIAKILRKNPSLNNYFLAEYQDNYQDAIKAVSLDFTVPKDSFIEPVQALDDDFFPG